VEPIARNHQVLNARAGWSRRETVGISVLAVDKRTEAPMSTEVLSHPRGGSPMARIVVLTEKQNEVLLDERVHPLHIEDEHTSLQILERLASAIVDASRKEQYAVEHYAVGE
jgi:hypothetical protein